MPAAPPEAANLIAVGAAADWEGAVTVTFFAFGTGGVTFSRARGAGGFGVAVK